MEILYVLLNNKI